jgi:hypothetical protein
MAILYSDKVIIGRTDCGFVFNFSTNPIEGVQPNEEITQIAMSPQFAKRFLVHLYTEMGKFEAEFGEIKMPTLTITELKSVEKPPMGFK